MKQVEQTLLAQMRITELDVQRRRELFGLGSEEMDLLAQCNEIIEEEIDNIVEEFYAAQTSVEEIALLIGDAETLRRLHSKQRQYVLDLFRGSTDMDYVSNRLRIGQVHKRIGVEPRLYLSALQTLKGIICKTLERRIEDHDLLSRSFHALEKLLLFDMTLVVDTYIHSLISEVETARRNAEKYAESLETQVAERTRQLKELSNRDPLTNLFNRRALMESLKKELAHTNRRLMPLSLIYFDVDRFKQFNDNYGHQFGDDVLKSLGEILLQHTREMDLPCRHGGDEFCVILPDCDYTAAEVVCNKIIDLFRTKFSDITLSFGIAQTLPGARVDPDQLVNLADRMMYEAKAEPGFRICKQIFPSP